MDEPMEDSWATERLDYELRWLEKKYGSNYTLWLRTDEETREFYYFVLN